MYRHFFLLFLFPYILLVEKHSLTIVSGMCLIYLFGKIHLSLSVITFQHTRHGLIKTPFDFHVSIYHTYKTLSVQSHIYVISTRLMMLIDCHIYQTIFPIKVINIIIYRFSNSNISFKNIL